MDLVLLFPGQGSQKPGMGQDLAERFPEAAAVFATVDEALGVPLSQLCWEGPADELTRTHNAQPALFTHGAALWAVLADRIRAHVRAAAGHSLGEFTAYHAAGSLGAADGARLVRRRGELMLDAGRLREGTMAAILGDLSIGVEELCERAAAGTSGGVVVPANYNSPGQVVLSGEVAAVERAMELARELGARRAVRLNVSGAFHSPLMRPAAEGLGAALHGVEFGKPAFPVMSNVSAAPVTEVDVAREMLARQLTAPVRWTDVVNGLANQYPDALFVELGPGNVLTGLTKRIAPQVATVACGTVAEVDQLLERIG